jgi:hypothetical protein
MNLKFSSVARMRESVSWITAFRKGSSVFTISTNRSMMCCEEIGARCTASYAGKRCAWP